MPDEWCMVCVINCCQFVRRLNMRTQTHTLNCPSGLRGNSDSQCCKDTSKHPAVILRTQCTNYDCHKMFSFCAAKRLAFERSRLKPQKSSRNASLFGLHCCVKRCVVPWIIFHFRCITPQEFQVFSCSLGLKSSFELFFNSVVDYARTTGFIRSN